MYHLAIVEELHKMGLSIANIKRHAGVKLYYSPIKRNYNYIPASKEQLEQCKVLAKWKMPLITILRKYPDNNPNAIFRYIQDELCNFNAAELYVACLRLLRRDGVPRRYVAEITGTLGDGRPYIATLADKLKEITPAPQRPTVCNQKSILVQILTYIHNKKIQCDYHGFYHLFYTFPEATQITISKAMVLAKIQYAQKCKICGKEFIGTRQQMFCKKCRSKA